MSSKNKPPEIDPKSKAFIELYLSGEEVPDMDDDLRQITDEIEEQAEDLLDPNFGKLLEEKPRGIGPFWLANDSYFN